MTAVAVKPQGVLNNSKNSRTTETSAWFARTRSLRDMSWIAVKRLRRVHEFHRSSSNKCRPP